MVLFVQNSSRLECRLTRIEVKGNERKKDEKTIILKKTSLGWHNLEKRCRTHTDSIDNRETVISDASNSKSFDRAHARMTPELSPSVKSGTNYRWLGYKQSR